MQVYGNGGSSPTLVVGSLHQLGSNQGQQEHWGLKNI